MSQETTTVLITGANRGVGRGLAEAFLARPYHTVIAAVRDPSAPTAQSLQACPPAAGSTLLLVQIEATSDTDTTAAVDQIRAAGISALDIVVANAGISGAFARVGDIRMEDLRRMVEVNTYATVRLLMATFPLLRATAAAKGPRKAPKFVAISSQAASLGDLEANAPYLLGSYGASKAAVNYLVRRAHFEYDWLVAFLLEPGFVQTDMGKAGANYFGMDDAIVPLKDSVEGLMKMIDAATKEETSGNFFSFDGTPMQL